MNICLTYGCGIRSNEDEWKQEILRRLPEKYNKFVMSSYKINEIKNYDNIKYEYFYRDVDLTNIDFEEIEKWIGMPVNTIIRRCWHYTRKNISKKEYSALVKYIIKNILIWKEYFLRNRIDIFYSGYESNFIEQTGHLVAEKLGIKIVFLQVGRISDTFYIANKDYLPIKYNILKNEAIEKYYGVFLERYKFKKKPEGEAVNKIILRKENISIFKKFIWYFKSLLLLDKACKKDPLREISVISTIFDKIIFHFNRIINSFFYDRVNLNENYFFYPLHFENDATYTLNNPLISQKEIVSIISKQVPSDVKLYVKSHPIYDGGDINLKDLLEMKKPNVKVISHKENSYELMKSDKCKGVIVFNSTVGFECIAFNKPLISMGNEEYSKEGISVAIKNIMDFKEIMLKEITFDSHKRKIFIANYMNNLIYDVSMPFKLGKIELEDEEYDKLATELHKAINYLINNS